MGRVTRAIGASPGKVVASGDDDGIQNILSSQSLIDSIGNGASDVKEQEEESNYYGARAPNGRDASRFFGCISSRKGYSTVFIDIASQMI